MISTLLITSVVSWFAPAASAYTQKDVDLYWDKVSRVDKNALLLGKEEIVGLGLDTCEVIKNGGDLYDLAYVVNGFEPEVQVLATTSMAYAITYLCGGFSASSFSNR